MNDLRNILITLDGKGKTAKEIALDTLISDEKTRILEAVLETLDRLGYYNAHRLLSVEIFEGRIS